MKLTAFHAADGDCCLIESRDATPRRVLIDGGRTASYVANTRDVLGAIRDKGGKLDVICVSHIDDDHISGIVRLIEDEVVWRQFEFLKVTKPTTKPPSIARPPKIGEVWHNGLFRLIGDETGHAVEPVLGTVATILAGSPTESRRTLASELDDIITGERSSMELTRRLSPQQLGIPLNPRSDGRLVKRSASGPAKPFENVKLGSLRLFLLGPSQDDIDRLRVTWQKFLDKSQEALAKLHQQLLRDEERLGALSPRLVANPMLDEALGDGLSQVTEANLASLMLLVEEGTKKVLMTGDGVSSEIIEGLQRHKKLDTAGRIHVDVLKVQHHGAKANVDDSFVRAVTADHYVFCGNGAHTNPELEVVAAFATARLQGFDGGPPIGPKRPFKFWFTSSPATPDKTKKKNNQKHMREVKALVTNLRQGHTAKMQSATFLTDGSFTIDL